MTFETLRTELRRLSTKLIPQARKKGYELELRESVDETGERHLYFEVAYRDTKGKWRILSYILLNEYSSFYCKELMADFKYRLKENGFKLL